MKQLIHLATMEIKQSLENIKRLDIRAEQDISEEDEVHLENALMRACVWNDAVADATKNGFKE